MTANNAALRWGAMAVAVSATLGAFSVRSLLWFLLDLSILAAVYVPLERLFPRVPQPVLRAGVIRDLFHFFVNHLLAFMLLLLAVLPAARLLPWARYEPLARAVALQPLPVQVGEIVVIADLFQYAIHRLFHRVPFLWRVHEVHHSSTELDWLASARLHLVDIVVVRAVTFVPLFVGGFSDAAIRTYLMGAAVLGVFLHANLRFRFGALEKVVTTPRYHAFHHAADPAARDKNFAFHLPIIDRLFGTQYFPQRAWPQRYGVDALAQASTPDLRRTAPTDQLLGRATCQRQMEDRLGGIEPCRVVQSSHKLQRLYFWRRSPRARNRDPIHRAGPPRARHASRSREQPKNRPKNRRASRSGPRKRRRKSNSARRRSWTKVATNRREPRFRSKSTVAATWGESKSTTTSQEGRSGPGDVTAA
jgi:sterol desaturase/sphingolipid hydroxylase (fatty acid hydroxylase superfamily)